MFTGEVPLSQVTSVCVKLTKAIQFIARPILRLCSCRRSDAKEKQGRLVTFGTDSGVCPLSYSLCSMTVKSCSVTGTGLCLVLPFRLRTSVRILKNKQQKLTLLDKEENLTNLQSNLLNGECWKMGVEVTWGTIPLTLSQSLLDHGTVVNDRNWHPSVFPRSHCRDFINQNRYAKQYSL